jgi:hypothetical protein
MKHISIKFAAVVITFTIGVAATAFWYAYAAPVEELPQVEIAGDYFNPTPRRETADCFPGRAVKLSSLTRKPGAYFSSEQSPLSEEWYARHLSAMSEPSFLSLHDNEDEAYRFLWLRSFHHPVAVRVWRSGDQRFLTVKELSGAGGYEPGKLIVNRTRALTEEEWSTFTLLLEDALYWQIAERDDDMGTDGAQWIVEGVREGYYHLADCWSPDDGSYRAACLYLLKISDIGISETSRDLY